MLKRENTKAEAREANGQPREIERERERERDKKRKANNVERTRQARG